MEKKPTYKEIKEELEAAIQQAVELPSEQERLNFVAEASLKLRQQQQEGLLSEEHYWVLSGKLGLFAKEAFSARDLEDDLANESWLQH